MKDIFDKNLSECDIKTLKDFYKHYYKKFWCFKNSYKRFKLLDETITISGICLVIIGTITGGKTQSNHSWCCEWSWYFCSKFWKKNYKKKIEMKKTAFTTYEKVLVELRSAL